MDLGTVVIFGWSEKEIIYPQEILENPQYKWKRAFLIGELYSTLDLKMAKVPPNVTVAPIEPGHLFYHNRKNKDYSIYYQGSVSAFSRSLEFLKRSDEHITYICYDPYVAADIFELAALVKTETFDRKYWSCMATGIHNFMQLPDVFTGPTTLSAVITRLTPETKDQFKQFILLGLNHLRMFLFAGYHLKENNYPVDGWVLQIGSPWLSLILSINKITPGWVDSKIDRELFESSEMRKLVTDKTLTALSNYFTYVYIKVTPELLLKHLPPGAAPTDNYQAWTTPSLWEEIYEEYASPENQYY